VNLKVIKDTINFLGDDKGGVYVIPNFCINDPFFEKELKPAEEVRDIKFIKVSFSLTKGHCS